MAVDLNRYRKNKGKAAPLMVNIRLARRGTKPTKAEVIEALREILATGEVPEGWRLAVINWRRPSAASSGWRTGRLDAFNNLAPVIQAALHNARVAVVRRGKR